MVRKLAEMRSVANARPPSKKTEILVRRSLQ